MIQFNLLPDVKLEYIKAAKMKRLVISISAVVSSAVIVVVGLLATTVMIFQKNHINNLNQDISRYRNELETTDDIDKILTIQNQLNSLPGLHDKKPAATRVFQYIRQLTPENITLSSLDISFVDGTIEMTGNADAIATVNQFVDTLKFTEFSEVVEGVDTEPARAFSDVVLESVSRGDDKTSYSINLKFKPEIFDNSKSIKLVVPNITSSRSEIGKPIFEAIEVENQ